MSVGGLLGAYKVIMCFKKNCFYLFNFSEQLFLLQMFMSVVIHFVSHNSLEYCFSGSVLCTPCCESWWEHFGLDILVQCVLYSLTSLLCFPL